LAWHSGSPPRIAGGFSSGSALAESISEAMASAYLGNPSYMANGPPAGHQRAGAAGAFRLEANRHRARRRRLRMGHSTVKRRIPPPVDTIVTDTSTAGNTPARFAIGLSQPIFRGFRTVSETGRRRSTFR
jgi:hypothetical protein